MTQLGFKPFFREQIETEQLVEFELARIVAVDKNRYLISNGRKILFAEITGKRMFSAESPHDFPTVGDWVIVKLYDEESFAIIHDIVTRKSLLRRKTPGKRIEFQLIAANIDTAFIMQSMDADYSIRRLERYLAMIHESRIQPVVLLSKRDLLPKHDARENLNEILKLMPELTIVPFSNHNKTDIRKIQKLLTAGDTYCLLGSSGVGKTTLLNNLITNDTFKTEPVRKKDGKGRHATTRRQLIVLENGAMIIDTPGLRELGNMEIEAGLSDTFQDIVKLSEHCRYNDCTHTHENGCAVLAAIKDGRIPEKRYQNFIKMKKESAYNEMSWLEKRQKDRRFGKYVKSIMSQKKKNRF